MSSSAAPSFWHVWIGGILDHVARPLIAFGLLTHWAALLANGQMAVRHVQFHWKFEFGAEFFPTINQGELALMACLVFLAVAGQSREI